MPLALNFLKGKHFPVSSFSTTVNKTIRRRKNLQITANKKVNAGTEFPIADASVGEL